MEKHTMLGQNTLRYFSLFILTLQTTLTVLAMRYSRKQTEGGKDLYIATTLVLVSELIKFMFCLILLLIQKSGSIEQLLKALGSEVIFKPSETVKLAIPSSLYTIQNNLILLALSSLDAATFQVTYQLKILTTAFFSVLLLRKDIKAFQWLALIVLMSGVILVQFSSDGKQKEANIVPSNPHKHLIGMLAVVASSLSSGFAGVYYEKLLKESAQPSVIIRNIQLGIFSIIFGTAGVVINDWDKVSQRGFFDGYTSVVWLVIMLQAMGGLVVAAVIKYADNILKGFATSVSIILSCLCSYVVLHDLNLDLTFVLGTGLVILATFMYGIQSHNTPFIGSNSSNNLIVDKDENEDISRASYTKVNNDRTYQKLSSTI
ncbi:hypothetical protein OUZ56_015265 [Daphnia magna]|uniref:UDP-N-acetylglucosamine transporter n=1 Tax=Daphnia magna TaxID=35525 RepID=A0ABR0AMC7_9CRUS|nr:hypothetical protein OUZ56_015265 [Daphnia magna]